MSRRPVGPVLFLVGAALLLGVGLVVLGGGPRPDKTDEIAWWRGEDPACPNDLRPEDVDRGIELVTDWLVANQLPHGAFVDARDVGSGDPDLSVDPRRQAVATWALARAHRVAPDPRRAGAADQALDHLQELSARGADGIALAWPGLESGDTAALALVALAATERLADPTLDAARREALTPWRDGLLELLQASATGNHRVRATYDPAGAPSEDKARPSADAATLLALTRAARVGREDLAEPAKIAWRAAWLHDVQRPLEKRRDPPVVKETWPWLPLALAELARSGWLDTEDASPHLLDLGRWMVDDHQTLRRAGNTAYAQVGLQAAVGWAREAEDDRAGKLQCVTDRALARLLTWQVGHPRATGTAASALEAPHVSGGVLAGADTPSQRVDYAGHLLVALVDWRAEREAR